MAEPLRNDAPIVTPVVIGLTRPPMMFGIPYNAFIIIVGLTVIAFLAMNSFWAVLIAPVAYGALFTFCSRDVRVLDIMQIATRKCPRVPNKGMWGTNTYGQ